MKFRTSVPREIGRFILQAYFRSTCTRRRRLQLALPSGRKSCGGSGGSPTCFAACTKIKSWWPSCPSHSGRCGGSTTAPVPTARLSCVRQTFLSGGHFALRRQFLRWLHRICSSTVLKIIGSSSSPQDQLHVLRHEQWAWRKKRLRDPGRRY